MKKRFLSLFLILVMVFSSMPVIASSETAVVGAAFTANELTPGTISAELAIAYATDDITFAIGYYSSDNELVKCASATLSIPEGAIVASGTLSMDTPDVVSNGDYAKIMAYDKETLKPYVIGTGTTLICCNKTRVNTYSGMNERFYTIDSDSGSLSVSKRAVSVAEEGTAFRIKDMTDGFVAFEDITNTQYRLDYTEADGLRAWFYAAGNAKQLWKLEEYNEGYAIAHANGGYLAIEDGAAVVQENKYEWSLTFYSETPFTLMTSLEGFKLFTEDEQQRIIDICTSVGADALPYATNKDSFLDKCETTFKTLYYGNYAPAMEKTMILKALQNPVMGSLASTYYTYPTFPGAATEIIQATPVKTKKVIWDVVQEGDNYYTNTDEHPYLGEAVDCYLIKVTYKSKTTTQTVDVYCVDLTYSNVQAAIEALGKFPYEYRQYIKTLYVYKSNNTSTYNCGGNELFVRLTTTANAETMAKTIAHELGHSLDFCTAGGLDDYTKHWCQSDEWQNALKNDIVTVSTYGNSNDCEGLAEFARLYWHCYGNRDLMSGIKQLFPNRFKSYQNMLKKAGLAGDIIY